MSFNGKVFGDNFIALLPYLGVTFEVMIGSFLVSLLLGFLAAKGSIGKNRPGRLLSRGYINLMRCVPPIVLLFVIYYGLPIVVKAIFRIDMNTWTPLFFAIMALSLLHGASMAELMRASYQAIDKGQREAAVSIGLSEVQAFFRIVLPQALVVALPILGNTVISMLRDGALAYSIGVIDITGRASYLISMNLGGYVMETYLALALIYWILSILTKYSFQKLEIHLRKGSKR